ncbi:MAG: hypothetical protein OEW78_04335 [Nitrosopumilus sp.]|uniref:hypothetical protein n=1 Tax=Nitrosopumilus sp. TaxID=2024843 RepID=UPI00246F6A39|nr:hypothetical protein [Nitrosopumilus sp.]MDH5431094.1 hypothetical protein [Nitrosopumilus sp.]MDH5665325.1 hypothetical protein [Nitrosopumilus sp.]
MNNQEKFQNKLLCTCNENVYFEIIGDIECDWGNHVVIQCPKCEELFSVDCECPAFQNISNLLKNNPSLFSNSEKLDYMKNSHPK